CRENFLSVPRMREWRDVAGQLARTLRELGWRETSVDPESPQGYRAIHRALTAGLLGNIGIRDEPEASYTGARGIKFWIHPVSADRRVAYGPIDPTAAHEIFIREALVRGALETRAPFLAHNRRLIADIERLEHKSRRPDILVDEELIHAFYAARVPAPMYHA